MPNHGWLMRAGRPQCTVKVVVQLEVATLCTGNVTVVDLVVSMLVRMYVFSIVCACVCVCV